MNDIIENNTYILNVIILLVLVLIIIFISLKLWERYIGFNITFRFNLKEKEDFSQISLEKQVKLYDDYRNYIEGKDFLTSNCSTNKRMLPYIVSPKCFTNEYINCMKEDRNEMDGVNEMDAINEMDMDSTSSVTIQQDDFLDESFYLDQTNFKIKSTKCQDQSFDKCYK